MKKVKIKVYEVAKEILFSRDKAEEKNAWYGGWETIKERTEWAELAEPKKRKKIK